MAEVRIERRLDAAGIEGGLYVASGIRLARRDHERCRRFSEYHLRLHPDPQ